MALTDVAHAVTRTTIGSEQCTHLLELAGLAIATAARGVSRLQYDIEVDAPVHGLRESRLRRDEVPVLTWSVQDNIILGPAPYTNIHLMDGMARWALTNLSTQDAEAALVLRRCTGIAKGRGINLDAQIHAKANGHCFAQQPRHAESALRMVGTTWDFAGRPEQLCRDDLNWLEFKTPY